MKKEDLKNETAEEIATRMEQRLADAIDACQKILRVENAGLTKMASRIASAPYDDVRALVESPAWKRACRVTAEAAVALQGLDLAARHYPTAE